MIFKDSELLTNLYAGIVKQQFLSEAKKDEPCVKSLNEAKKAKNDKPDYLDADEDGDKKKSMKKALRDKAMKESSNFKDLFMAIINEEKVCGCTINKGAQYNCVTKDGDKKVLKGESVIMMKDKLKSVKAAHKK